ncbi:MAG: hypothetical protein ACE5G0_07960 [Rhodothermales bacterium]
MTAPEVSHSAPAPSQAPPPPAGDETDAPFLTGQTSRATIVFYLAVMVVSFVATIAFIVYLVNTASTP